ncbi:DUF3533 domain-containing protein [Rossellomorea aquimaris]|uniref:YhgE/Pip domain-containing protein n=1 Tax=Rossellomorea aquimaris TaxID=189382 RepID=UPI001CD1DEFA|nr:DUF3533 domain-containing protein [Rossellomorea aquimaris]MCA1054074.1 DUF3533 domain-containing protein [Rossellomorea aquimaris]
MFKNKLVLLSPIIALAIVFIFSLTLFPSVQPQPKNLPIAIVNQDQGTEITDQTKLNVGSSMVEMVKKQSKTTQGEDPAIKWVEVDSVKAVQQGLDDQQYYAALVIPEDFSAKQASLRTATPSSSDIQLYINQGMNPAAANMAGQMLNGIVDQMNNTVRAQLLEGFKASGTMLTPEQASLISSPINKNVIYVNEIGTNSANGNAPVTLFQPLWIASMASAAILTIAISKVPVTRRREKVLTKAGQIGVGAVVTFVIGFGLTSIVNWMVGLSIPHFFDTAMFLWLTSFCFFLMISAVLSVLGIRGIAVFALLLFFGAPLLAMAPEMLSSFYREWVYSWLPMRFMVEGLRKLFFFGEGLSWEILSNLVWIGAVSVTVILATGLKRKQDNEVKNKGSVIAEEV